MMISNGTANIWSPEELRESASGGGGGGGGEGTEVVEFPAEMVDMEVLWNLLSETESDSSQSRQEDSSLSFAPHDSRSGVLDGSLHSKERAVIFDPPLHSCSGSLTDLQPIQDHGQFCSDKENAFYSSASNIQDDRLSHSHLIAENNLKASVTSNMVESSRMEIETLQYNESHALFSSGQISDLLDEPWEQYSDMLLGDSLHFPSCSDFDFGILPCDGDNMLNVKDEEWGPSTWDAGSNNIVSGEGLTRRTNEGVVDGYSNTWDINVNFQHACKSELHFTGYKNRETDCKVATQSWAYDPSYVFSRKQEVCAEDLKDDIIDRKPFSDADAALSNDPPNPFSPCLLPSNSGKSHLVYRKDENEGMPHESGGPHNHLYLVDNTTLENPFLVQNDCALNGLVGDKYGSLPSTSVKQGLDCVKTENIHSLQKTNDSCLLTTAHQSVQSSSLAQRTCAAPDDDDVCILEDISASAQRNPCPPNGKSLVNLQHATFSETSTRVGAGYMRFKPNGEQFVFRTALQDLSQPRSEDKPPDGVLAVPLLRHQRIALSWMVKKETTNPRCSGGILADDQGLGKTISTIALILKERSPSVKTFAAFTKQTEAETLNLDDDDDAPTKLNNGANSCQPNGCSATVAKPSAHAKGRAAAGTLIVCPTSVLRQWFDELHNKVANTANLSVLVYHGCNRTKDPFELAKYDVVLTTYSIVSMEVPKQPLVDDEDETQKHTTDSLNGVSSSRKRKSPLNSGKKSLKGKKGTEGELLDTDVRPLARVAWFRVVLDEAQSIKNHKTQVARACWGLRAKRRWCLSGTPIQNAIDDLYSYFRFLRFEPYSSYKLFCSSLKVPIQKHPTSGYRKLQTVLKTVMLRRTKGSQIDGEPILTLPPKRIELKKVEFTQEERGFYCRLEAESRAQFAKYAAAGTVKQNYVNILLMLLRLRQACDHPYLVGGSNSSLDWRSSIEMAKKLPQEKRILLLNCLEASLAICSICSDAPEDAVVTVCGHVFCNQCICEHLTGDDTHCPATDCKTQLIFSSLFSKKILTDSASDQPSLLNNPDYTGSESGETSQPYSFGCSYGSSKIKAALEVLQSLSKSRDCPPMVSSPGCKDEGNCYSENTSDSGSGVSHVKMNSGLDGNSNHSTKIPGEKALVFSQWTGMLDLLEACLKKSSIQYRRLDGTMSVAARDKAVKDFKTIPEVSVMIMSLKAASLGLNMVAACHVILLDLWWNPTTEDQAIDRAHRIGQTRPVTVLRLTVKDTVEDRILALQQKKREMVASAFGEDENGSRQTRLTVEDLEYLFRH
ncbi:helicase-like transcription factor CHR28 isoform X2 [Ipomoea triloba]|uniref:helicase-like transcription factor CHR28 isoform X2 n=1 Tax=Ipomoea triloba TaxID=35885 RepID=UPI00125D0E7E|nr:helicase-like transcription factor CHR28 isoform X2 [Ipomoea triloba]